MPNRLSSLTELTVANRDRLSWGQRTYVMGVINVTPDSFSGDGLGGDVDAAVEQAIRFEGEGADFLDIGAESTRPGHRPVTEEEEMRRLLPSLEAAAAAGFHSLSAWIPGSREWHGRRWTPGPALSTTCGG